LRELEVINGSSRGLVGIGFERINDFFVSGPSSSSQLVLEAHSIMNVPEFSFINVDSTEVSDAVLSVKSNAAWVDEIPLSFVRVLLPVILPALTYIYNYIFTFSEFPHQWKTSVVLPFPKKANPSNVYDFRPISLQQIFSKVAEILMGRQMNSHIRCNNLLTEYQFRKFHSLESFTQPLSGTNLIRSADLKRKKRHDGREPLIG
jgi:hypothetical protein